MALPRHQSMSFEGLSAITFQSHWCIEPFPYGSRWQNNVMLGLQWIVFGNRSRRIIASSWKYAPKWSATKAQNGQFGFVFCLSMNIVHHQSLFHFFYTHSHRQYQLNWKKSHHSTICIAGLLDVIRLRQIFNAQNATAIFIKNVWKKIVQFRIWCALNAQKRTSWSKFYRWNAEWIDWSVVYI